jgi:hypothetical protein
LIELIELSHMQELGLTVELHTTELILQSG